MKLFTDETKSLVAFNAWVVHKGRRAAIPAENEFIPDSYMQGPLMLDSLNGTFKLYECRQEDSQLNWKYGPLVVIREGDQEPQDCEYRYYEHVKTFTVAVQHDGISILSSTITVH